MNSRLLLSSTFALALVGACASTPKSSPQVDTAPQRTTITDLASFEAYIATRPTPGALRQQYPGLHVVLPGDITTKELRSDTSRYFADLDVEGRISGGRFQ